MPDINQQFHCNPAKYEETGKMMTQSMQCHEPVVQNGVKKFRASLSKNLQPTVKSLDFEGGECIDCNYLLSDKVNMRDIICKLFMSK